MKRTVFFSSLLVFAFVAISICAQVRKQADTVGFAKDKWQMDFIYMRIPTEDKPADRKFYKAAICPHDDYAYAAGLYARTLAGIKASTVIIIGVAHKAKKFGLENKLIMDSFSEWRCAGGNIKISPMRQRLVKTMPAGSFIVHDSIMMEEHSLEALNPFLSRNIFQLQILPVLVPPMSFDNMEQISSSLSKAVYAYMVEKKLTLGKDVAIVISSDGLHYGDQDWGGADMAPFGTDSVGTARAVAKDQMIINDCLRDKLTQEKIRKFYEYTVSPNDFREYSWTWCGRYSVPFGMLFLSKLNDLCGGAAIKGEVTGYRSGIDTPHIKVGDIGMGVTALANQRHWVSYVGILFD